MHDAAAIADIIAARPFLTRSAQDGLLADSYPLADIARQFGTPTYVTGARSLAARAAGLCADMPGVAVHYAVKANDHVSVLSLLAQAGLGADVVSGGEMARAINAGFAPRRLVFSGVGKSDDEIVAALRQGCGQINAESVEELHDISRLATARGLIAPVALRINPDIDARTHDKISTGRAGDKFGIPYDQALAAYTLAHRLPGVAALGFAVHIGSQIFASAAYARAYAKMADLIRAARQAGLPVAVMDGGGGLGVAYRGEAAISPACWYGLLRQAFAGLDVALAVEPGRWLAAPAALLLTRVIRARRHGLSRPIYVVDAAMNDFMRPAIYDAYHEIVPVAAADLIADRNEAADMVGPVCESADIFGRARRLPPLAPGSLLAILDCGAYGTVMASTYNSRPRAAHIWVDGLPALITARGATESLWQDERLPDPRGARAV